MILIKAVLAAAFVMTQPAMAQYFGTSPSSPSAKTNDQTVTASPSSDTTPSQQNTKENETYSVVDTSEQTNEVQQQPVNSPFDYAYGKQQAKKQAPTQPQRRRYSTVGGVTVETTDDSQEDELIMLYMKNFNIYRSPSGKIRCSARFAVLTTLPVRLSNISYRLKWPKMETALSFSDVEPGVENHFDYALLGDGCYTMDKQPNIIINRCRAKGLSQRQCASRVRWIKAM